MRINVDIKEIKRQAELELKEEEFRVEVDKYKEKLKRKKSMWDVIFPWKILIIKKGD